MPRTSIPAPIAYRWGMTVQTSSGQRIAKDGRIVMNGPHSSENTREAIRSVVQQQLGTSDFTVVSYSATRNQL